ncbi:hypothetical protein DM01DRAFT_1409214 [Hesseltinella vesiculosa]|uniref:Vesicle transport protein USE1 n=1 Tax=Hesseltinella vesiculosa TaxID=101127 RepID=A0A1X2GC36_9FUNG|nr:hypothetical protein DM01DRAFT_1409214 [Hesseltinella vesiculosa]
MAGTTDEVNIQRLLQYCEDQVQDDNADLSSLLERSKLLTYIQYLDFLAQKLRQRQSPGPNDYGQRIERLRHYFQESIKTRDHGVQQTEKERKAYLAQLQQLEQTDPDWLTALKRGDHQDEEDDDNEEPKKQNASGLDLDGWDDLEEDVLTTKVKVTTMPPPPSTSLPSSEPSLRQRPTKPNKSREEETANIENVLQHHRQLHDDITMDLSKMAKQLKMNTQNFGDVLQKDKKVLEDANTLVESNLSHMKQERKRLDAHYSKSWGTTCMNLGVVLFVCIMFVFVFFTIKFLPKA